MLYIFCGVTSIQERFFEIVRMETRRYGASPLIFPPRHERPGAYAACLDEASAKSGPACRFDQLSSARVSQAIWVHTPNGWWKVKVGVWNWIYVFSEDHTADWRDIVNPGKPKGRGQWVQNQKVMRIDWETGSIEDWSLPPETG